jgi:hypothetical protein
MNEKKELFLKLMLSLVLSWAVCILIGYRIGEKHLPKKATWQEFERVTRCEILVPSPVEFQAILNKRSPYNEPVSEDGKFGPRTLMKWEQVYGEQSAAKYFEKVKEKK